MCDVCPVTHPSLHHPPSAQLHLCLQYQRPLWLDYCHVLLWLLRWRRSPPLISVSAVIATSCPI